MQQPLKGKEWLKVCLYRRLLGPAKSKTTIAGYKRHARGLRNCLREHFIDYSLLTAVVRLDGRTIDIQRYLAIARSKGREGLLFYCQERPNVVPLLGLLLPYCWGRRDLFSRAMWVQDENGQAGLVAVRGRGRFSGLPDKRTWRWLMACPISVIRGLLLHRIPDGQTLKVFARAVQQARAQAPVAVAAQSCLARSLGSMSLYGEMAVAGNDDVYYRLFLLFLRQSSQVWAEQGHAALRQWLVNEGRRRLVAYAEYISAEGAALGYPADGTTWQSFHARVEQWHVEGLRQARQQQQLARPSLSWTSLIEEMVIGDYLFTALCSSEALWQEGDELSHCVGWNGYDQLCAQGCYRVFSVQDEAGNRSTLGLSVDVERSSVAVNQHYTHHNQAVPEAAAKAGELLARAYAEALAGDVPAT